MKRDHRLRPLLLLSTEERSRCPQGAPDAHFVPIGVPGRARAIKVYGVCPGGRMAEVGLQSGDRIVAINGLTIEQHWRNPVHALQVERRLLLHIERRGERHLLYWEAPTESRDDPTTWQATRRAD
jgi:predicted metalloprotease with PDZ domain